jgi:hypothetical protein
MIQYHPVPAGEVFSFALVILIFFINLEATITLYPLAVYILLSNPIFPNSLSCFILFPDLFFILTFKTNFLINVFSFSLSLNVFQTLGFAKSIIHLNFKVPLFTFKIQNSIPLTSRNPSKITINVRAMLSFKN